MHLNNIGNRKYGRPLLAVLRQSSWFHTDFRYSCKSSRSRRLRYNFG